MSSQTQLHDSFPESMELSQAISRSQSVATHDFAGDETDTHRPQYALPPTDEGFQAWFTVFASFLSNGLIWGFALSFGVMQEYYTSNEPFASRPDGIAAIGTTTTGISYLTMPVYLAAFQRFPQWRKYALWISLPAIAIALVGASFAQAVPHLIITQGVIYAIAGNALVMPSISYLNEWFARRRSLAIGIAIGGDGVGGAVMPLILQALLGRVGFRWTLRIEACIIVVLALPLMFTLKPRLPTSGAHASPKMDISFMKDRLFWIMQAVNTIQALGYFLPINYLPSIAEALGLNSTLGSLTTTFINLAMVFGCVIVGSLSDRFDVNTVMFGVSVGTAISVFTVLGFTTSIAPLFIFSVLYGLTASAYSTTWGGIIKEVQKVHEATDANVLFGLLAAGRGIGSVISGPLSESLLESSKGFNGNATSAYGSQYGPIIIFSGVTAFLGGVSWCLRRASVI